MNIKARILPFLFISVLFTSCFNGLKSPKETIVSFNMDESTVRKIVELSGTPRNPSRAAGDTNGTEIFIDVTLCGDLEQTKTAPLTDEIKIDFENVLVNSRVYAKAQVFKYIDAAKTQKEVFYRGESNTIVVHEGVNAVSIKLTNATLTVTFESNGGTQIEEVKVLTGAAVKEPETPVKPVVKKKYSKENYAFAGWYKDAELTQAYNFALPVKDDLTLYAKWLPGFVFVEGATVNNYLAANRNLKISDLYVSDHEVSQAEYYEVTGKNPSNHTVSEIEEYPVENVTWFDAIEYCNLLSIKEGLTPCYTINGSTTPAEWGTISSSTQVSFNLAANGYRLPTEAEWEYVAEKSFRSNVDFGDIALYSENSMNSTWQIDNRKADELGLNSILGNVAEWCFDAYSDSITRTTGASGPTPASNTAIARVVRGGSYQSSKADCSSTVRASADQASKSPAIGFRVVRKVVNEYKVVTSKVTFVTNGGSSVETQSVIEGDTATQPADPTKTGYIFKGWNYAGEDFEFSTPITQDITLEAKWTAIKYTITYDLDYGTLAVNNPDKYTIETETFTLNTPVKNSYNFKGWYNGEQKVTKIEKGSYGNLNLVAHWTQCHIVSFDRQDGSAADEQEVENNDTAIAPTAPTREGFEFVRWYETNENTAFDFTTPITGNVTLKALWQYKVTYNSSGGTDVAEQTYNHMQAVTEPAAPTRTGFTFDCWCSDSNLTTQYSFNSASTTGDITLYARWKYTVTYDKGNGEAPITVDNIHTAPVTAPAEPSWFGFVFVCWCSDSNLTNEYTFGSSSTNGNITLYAKWKYLVTFDTNEAGYVPQQWVIYPQYPTVPDPSPSKDHFEFEYWCTNLSDPENTKYEFNAPFTNGNTTLHAKFKTINENLGGITVTFGIATGDISVTTNDSSTAVTYTVDTSGGEYDSYYWEFDGVAQSSTTAVLSLNKSTLSPGVFDVYIEAEKDDVTYSWSQQITISN